MIAPVAFCDRFGLERDYAGRAEDARSSSGSLGDAVMNRTSFAALALLSSFVTLVGPGCSSSDDTPSGNAGTGPQNTSGAAPVAGTGTLPIAGTTSGGTTGTAGSTSAAGSGGAAAGTSSGGTATAGGGAGGVGGGSAGGAGGSAGATAGGGGSGGAAAGAGGAGGSTTNPNCPVKIDSSTACTAMISCPAATCGVFKLGSKDCNCAAASGNFMCSSCTYKGTESIVQAPMADAPLTACAMDDATMEGTVGCTKGMRCKSLDMVKNRFCACWDDPVKGGTAWDCDAVPSAWPK
jgi:hypothetical protein